MNRSDREQLNNNSSNTTAKSIINPNDLTQCLLSCLNEREQNIVKSRFALEGIKKETLEAIGDRYQITRERVRQIENASLNKIKRLIKYKEILQNLINEIDKILDKFGGILAHHHLVEELLDLFKIKKVKQDVQKERNQFDFVLKRFINEFFHFETAKDIYKECWSKHKSFFRLLKGSLEEIEQCLIKHAKPLSHRKIAEHLNRPPDSIYSYLQLSKNLIQDPFGNWGISHWPEVSPRRMADKVYVVLKKYAQPLHYKDIALYIEKHYNKKSHAPTVHNELIADPRFVLVGRGIYALREWGYVPGTIKNIVEQTLSSSKKSLSKDEIMERVLKQRLVARSSVLLAINNNKNIKEIAKDQYILRKD